MTKILFLIFFMLLTACDTRLHLGDYYYIYSEDSFGYGYYLTCKLGCEYDAHIDYIEKVRWNDKYILVNKTNKECFVIKARGEELACCNRDTIIGPMNTNQLDEYIKTMGIKNLNEENFKYKWKKKKPDYIDTH